MALERRWSTFLRSRSPGSPEGLVELGEICRVHRGQVTGANRVWVQGSQAPGLPQSVLFPAVTRAAELYKAGETLIDGGELRRVIDIPVDYSDLGEEDRQKIERFLAYARSQGAHTGYVATNRRAWWSVGLREPAPILATYMARRIPAFVRNLAQVRHLNIAHGIYPREPLSEAVLRGLARHLSANTCLSQGRTYAGGLVKFEPREMERLLVPRPELIDQGTRS